MENKRIASLALYFVLSIHLLSAQDGGDFKFGKISPMDFQLTAPKSDTGASAVIIADIGKSSFEGNGNGFFSIVYTHFMRVKIINKNGFEAGDYRIFLYNDRQGHSEKIFTIKGSTFNLVGGAIQETKLDPKMIFQERHSKVVDLTKFSMPALKEGSIYDLIFTTKSSNFAGLRSWSFQREYPCLWNEYEVTIPSAFHYLVKTNGDGNFDIRTDKPVQQTFSIRRNQGAEFLSVSCTSIQSRWVKKNTPAIKAQPYLSTVDNYVSKVSFELNYYQQDNVSDREMEIGNWNTKSHELIVQSDFGFELDQDNTWMDKTLTDITEGASGSEEKTKRVFQYVRDHFHCTDFSELYVENSLKDVFNNHSGSVAEINLLMVALLRHLKIIADPAILSTRDNGVTTRDYPLINEYNYVICIARPGGKMLTLDASQPHNGFGKLPSYCYNWGARVINEQNPELIMLSPDSVAESRTTNSIFVNDENGSYSGSFTAQFGNAQSFDIREQVKKTSAKEYFKSIREDYGNMIITNEGFDSLDRPDFPLTFHCDMEPKDIKNTDILYFNPVMGFSENSNPFSDAERLYPVEFSYKMDYTYLLTMEIPKGFKVDELPKSTRVNFNENQGMFEYLIQQSNESIQMRVHLKFNGATFSSDQYPTLRDFFAFVVKKENEQIVFKKK